MSTNEEGQSSDGKKPGRKPRPNESPSDGTSGAGTSHPWWEFLGEVLIAVVGGIIDVLGDD